MFLRLLIIFLCFGLASWGDYPPGTEPTRKTNLTYLTNF